MIISLLLLCLAVSLGFAANYGKITGKVTNAANGEPIVGANITLADTYLGAATNQKGQYVILQVPPGRYTVKATMIGYTPVQIRDVEVYAGRIAYADFEMESEVLDMAEVIVEAERPVIERDLTATTRNVSTEDIEAMPTTTVNDVIQTQPGVIRSGGLHFRGGRSGEVTYMVDGVPLVNPLFSDINSSQMINKSVISDLQVISGTYSAEYGNAMSGVINITTQEGGDRLRARLDMKSSRLGLEGSSVDYNRNILRANLSGPLLRNRTRFFLSGNYDARDNYLPWGYRKEGNIFAKLTDRHIDNIKLSMVLNLSRGVHKNYSHSYKYIPKQAWYEPRDRSNMYRLSLSHTLAANLFYTMILYHTYYHYDSGDYDYHDLTPAYSLDENNEFYTFNYVGSYSRDDQHTTGIKGDLVWQINDNNEVKAGFLGKYHVIDRFYISSPYYDDHILDDYVKRPREAALYVQDKINFSTIILSAGLRYDLMDPNAKYWQNPYDVDDVSDSLAEQRLKSAEIHSQISPRLGISYPVTDKTVFHFGYGHYFQRPEYQFIYKGLITYDKDTAQVQPPAHGKPKLYDVDNDGDIDYKDNMIMNLLGGNGRFGDPNLQPKKTISYEFGVSQQLFEDYVLDVTVYSKQITDLLGARTYFAGDQPEYWETFSLHVNDDFAYNNGFEIQFRKRRGQYATGELNYTYAVAEGSSSGPLERVGSELENRQTLKFFPLDFDQRHTLNGRLTLRYQDLKATLLGQWGSGLPYTKEMRAATDPYEINNGRMPPTWTLDLKVDYAFNFGRVQLIPYLEIYNLTDRRNVVWVYARTGKPGDSNSGKTKEWDRNPENWGRPRIIYLGLNVTL